MWALEYEDGHTFHLAITTDVLEQEGLLAERLMELVTGGWMDTAGEEDQWVLVGSGQISEEEPEW